MLRLALLLIFGVPALYFGLCWSWRGIERGLIERRVPWAEEVVTGKLAVVIGLYSLFWFTAFLGVAIWLVVAVLG